MKQLPLFALLLAAGLILSSGCRHTDEQQMDSHRLIVQQNHTGQINQSVLSPDGSMMATAAYEDHTVKVWDVHSGRLMMDLTHSADTSGHIMFTPSSKYLVSSGEQIAVFNLETGNLVREFAPFVRERSFRTVQYKDDTVDQKDLVTGFSLSMSSDEFDPEGLFNEVVFLGTKPDGLIYHLYGICATSQPNVIASIGIGIEQKEILAIRFWDIVDAKLVGSIRMDLHENYTRDWTMRSSPDGKYLFIVHNSQYEDTERLTIIDTQKMKHVQSFDINQSNMKFWGPDNNTILTLKEKPFEIASWDVPSGLKTRSIDSIALGLQIPVSPHYTIRLAEGILAVNLDGQLNLYEWPSLKRMNPGSIRVDSNDFDISADGRTVAANGRVYSTASGQRKQDTRLIAYPLVSASFPKDNRFFLASDNESIEVKLTDTIELCNRPWRTLLAAEWRPEYAPVHSISSLYLMQKKCNRDIWTDPKDDNRSIIAVGSEKSLTLFDSANMNPIQCFEVMAPQVVAIHPNGKLVAFSSEPAKVPGSILLGDIESGKIQTIYTNDSSASYSSSYNDTFTFSPSGQEFLFNVDNFLNVFDLKRMTISSSRESEMHGYYSGGAFRVLAFHPDGGSLAGIETEGRWPVYILDQKLNVIGNIDNHQNQTLCATYIGDGSILAIGDEDGSITLWDHRNRKITGVISNSGNIPLAMRYSEKTNRLIVFSSNNQVSFVDMNSLQTSITYAFFDDHEYIAYLPSGYYYSSIDGSDYIRWLFPGPKIADFSQYHSQFACTSLKELLSKQNQKDVKIVPPPRVELENAYESLRTDQAVYAVKAVVRDSQPLKSIRIFINGKLEKEMDVSASETTIEESLPMHYAMNRITVVAFNESGYSSYPVYLDVLNDKLSNEKPNLYLVSIGVSRYPGLDPDFQLDYAHKDATDIAAAFSRQKDAMFKNVIVRDLSDEKATLPNITAALDQLKEAGDNDLVIIFLAGHGMIDSTSGKYYFLTPACTLDNIAANGLDWDVFDRYLKDVKPRIVLMMDTCHSGSVNRSVFVPSDRIVESMVADQRSGVTIFSASKGRQQSIESPMFEQGCFTQCLLEALGYKKPFQPSADDPVVDLNANSYIEFSEMSRYCYVIERVDRLSNGFQTPRLVRQEILGDFPVARVNLK